MRNRSTDEEVNRGTPDEIRDRGTGGRGNRWDQSRFDVRPTAGDAGWAEPPHDIRRSPPPSKNVPQRTMNDWNRSDWEGGGAQATDASFARSRMQQALAGKGPRNYVRSDERIREDAYEALTYQNALDATEIEVAVSGGEITLTGTVLSREEKRAAEDLCHGVRGAKDVHNQLRVKRSDARDTAPAGNPERDANTDGTSAPRR